MTRRSTRRKSAHQRRQRWRRCQRALDGVSRWLCARLGHFEGMLEPRCDFCDTWLAPYPEPRFDLRDLRYDPPELAPVRRPEEQHWVPGAVYS